MDYRTDKSSSGSGSSKIEYNPGIHCDVSNCKYNDKHFNCYAEKINVGPTHASSEADTLCSTFKSEIR